MTKDEIKNHPVYTWLLAVSNASYHDPSAPYKAYGDTIKLQNTFLDCGGKGHWVSSMMNFLQDAGLWDAWMSFYHNMPREWLEMPTRQHYVAHRRAGAFAVVLSHLGSVSDDPGDVNNAITS